MNKSTLKILLVDDEERILRSLGMLLRMQYEVSTTASGTEAIELLKTQDYHVLISDQRMPGMSGTELLQQARTVSPLTVRILLTGYADVEAGLASINEGEIFRYINKPWNPKELRDTVTLAAEISRHQRENSKHILNPSRTESSSSTTQQTILVLDPDPATAQCIKDLMGNSHQVIQVSTTEQSLRILSSQSVSVLVCELDLPGNDIETLIKSLKRAYPQLPAIVLSQLQNTRRIVELINQAQVFRYFSKPLRPIILKKSLEAALARHQQLQIRPLIELERQLEPIQEIREQLLSARILSQIQRLRHQLFPANERLLKIPEKDV